MQPMFNRKSAPAVMGDVHDFVINDANTGFPGSDFDYAVIVNPDSDVTSKRLVYFGNYLTSQQ